VIVVLVLAASKPATFRVSRRVSIEAAPEIVFANLEDFHRWATWSPWEELDPAMKREYSGSERGAGAIYTWDGNNKVGAGRMEILSATPGRALSVKLDFLRPFEGHNTADFTVAPEATATEVTWTVHGPRVFVVKLMSVFVSLDKLMGKDFERGLAKLKTVAEQASRG
jgi:uncharacterized protein YndB with AHSA1/START domain